MQGQSFKELMQYSRSYRRSFWAVVLTPVCAVVFAVWAICCKDFIFDFFPDCMLYTLTGFNCLSCGCTRATYALFRGDIATAIYYNPIYIVFLCWLVYVYVRLTVSVIRRPFKVYSVNTKLWQGITIGAVLVGFLILRNTPAYQAVFY